MTKFDEFLQCIRPDGGLLKKCKAAHERLRDDVKSYEETNAVTIGQFLQGSYSRNTLIAPITDEAGAVDFNKSG